MTSIEIPKLPNALSLNSGVFRASIGKPKGVGDWPDLKYVRPKVVVTKKSVQAYAAACQIPPEQGVPLLLPHIEAFPLAMILFKSSEFPYRAMGLVHLANRCTLHKNINVDDQLSIEVKTGKLFKHEKGQVLTLLAQATRDQELVWSSEWSFLRTGEKNISGNSFEPVFEDFEGLHKQAEIKADGAQSRRYGRMSGDINPIHMHYLGGRALGFKKAIAHGMWTKARALSLVMPLRQTQPCEVAVEFKSPIYLPSVTGLWVKPVHGGSRFEVRSRSGDRVHLRGEIKQLSGSLS